MLLIAKLIIIGVLAFLAMLASVLFAVPWAVSLVVWVVLSAIVAMAQGLVHSDEQEGDWVEQSPIVRLANAIVEQSIVDKAEALDIRPELHCGRVYWINDGEETEAMVIPLNIVPPLVRRFRVWANMDVLRTKDLLTGTIRVTREKREYVLACQNYFREVPLPEMALSSDTGSNCEASVAATQPQHITREGIRCTIQYPA